MRVGGGRRRAHLGHLGHVCRPRWRLVGARADSVVGVRRVPGRSDRRAEGVDVERYRSRSLWLATLDGDELQPRAPLDGDRTVDVAIVGAGFTGLWTAVELLARRPSLSVLVLESEIAGFGASGRNGGWCSALLPMSFDSVAREHGVEGARTLWAAMRSTVDEVGRRALELGIDCRYAKGGSIRLARNAAQAARLHDELAIERANGVSEDELRWLDATEARRVVDATAVRGALYTPHCAAIHPAALVRGLARAVETAGGTVCEQTRVTSIAPGIVGTDRGTVRARSIIRATEGYTPMLPGARRAIVPLYSLMIATEPLADDVWAQIGLADRPTFSDARRLIIYGQRTADGRLAFGGRGAPYHFGSSITDGHDRHDATHLALREILVDLFPVLANAAVTHAWGGPLGVPRDWACSVGYDQAIGLGWAGGYVGDGVATANLAGRTLADLVCGLDTPITRLPWVGHRSPDWPIEPARWIGINAAARLPAVVDRAEQAGRPPSRLATRMLDRLTGH